MSAKDILDDVMLSPAAVDAWRKHCRAAVLALHATGVQLAIDEYGVEAATLGDDGSLVMRVEIGSLGQLCMRVPADQWYWYPAKGRIN